MAREVSQSSCGSRRQLIDRLESPPYSRPEVEGLNRARRAGGGREAPRPVGGAGRALRCLGSELCQGRVARVNLGKVTSLADFFALPS